MYAYLLREGDDDLYESKAENVTINVEKGGQFNFVNDNGKINAFQNNNTVNQKENVEIKIWNVIIYKWCDYIDIDNWYKWTSSLILGFQPNMNISINKKLKELVEWMFVRVWPDSYSEVKMAMLNFFNILDDFLKLFDRYYKKKRNYYIIKTYTESGLNLNAYTYYIMLIRDLVFELTRAANYICDIVRQSIDAEFRTTEGKISVYFGQDVNSEYIICKPEYSCNERKLLMPYKELEQFKIDRFKRDIHEGPCLEEINKYAKDFRTRN